MVSLSEAASGHAAKTTPSRAGAAGTAVKSTKVSRAQAAGGHAAAVTASRKGIKGEIVGESIGSRYVREQEKLSKLRQLGLSESELRTRQSIQRGLKDLIETDSVKIDGLTASEIRTRRSIQEGLRDLIKTGAIKPEKTPSQQYASFFYKRDRSGALIVPSDISKIEARPFKTKDQIEFERKLKDFTNKVNANPNYTEEQKRRLIETFRNTGSVSIYKQVTKSFKELPPTLKESRKLFDKAVSETIKLPTLSEIAIQRDEMLESVGLLETQRRQREKVLSIPAARELLKFTESEYNEIRTEPATYVSELAALGALGVGFGAGIKGFTKVTTGVSRGVLGRQLAQRTILGSRGRVIPLVGKIAVEQLPTVALDTYFISEIGGAVARGAKIEGVPVSELGGGISTIIEAERRGKDVQWVTEQNLEIAKDLAVMAPFFGVGSKAVENLDVKIKQIEVSPKISKIAETVKLQAKRFVEDPTAQVALMKYEKPINDIIQTNEKLETLYITEEGIIPESEMKISRIGIREDVKLTPEMEEVLFGKPKVEPPKIEENYKISSIKISEDVKLTPEMERVLFGKSEGAKDDLIVKIVDQKIKNMKNRVPTDYVINSIKAKDIAVDSLTIREADSVFRILKTKREKIEKKVAPTLIKDVSKPKTKPKVKLAEKEKIDEIQKIKEAIKEEQNKIESAVDEYKEYIKEETIKEKEKEKGKLRERMEMEIIPPILKFDREIAKQLTKPEMDKFIRAYRIRKTKLGTIKTVLG